MGLKASSYYTQKDIEKALQKLYNDTSIKVGIKERPGNGILQIKSSTKPTKNMENPLSKKRAKVRWAKDVEKPITGYLGAKGDSDFNGS